MSSPQNNDQSNERVIPLEDAPQPNLQGPDDRLRQGSGGEDAGRSEEAAAESAFIPDPLNTLKFKPLVIEAVSKVFDPEIPVNIYELGLVYDIDVDSAANVSVRMTLTAPACPAAQTIPVDVERRVREVAGINDVKVAVVWDPPWTRDRMSDEAKLALGMY
jgi:FeS assembly SUF system protein